jgi:hypothetical protein
VPALVGTARVRVQLPLAAGEHSEPEPDLAVAPSTSHETATLIGLCSSARRGSTRGPAVPVYRVIDGSRAVVHVRTDPADEGYATKTQNNADDPLDACGVSLTLRDLRRSRP